MELDTGASITLLSGAECHQSFPRLVVRDSLVLSRTYSGKQIHVVGEMDVNVQYEHQVQDLVLTVVAGDGLSLLGENWLQKIQLNWWEILAVTSHPSWTLGYLLDKYRDIFVNESGTIMSYQAKLHIKSDEPPRFFKAQMVPYALRSSIKDDLDHFEWEGILGK